MVYSSVIGVAYSYDPLGSIFLDLFGNSSFFEDVRKIV